MRKIADLYIRVSTDEQANTGYSQRHQEEMLRKYCDMNSIQIRKVIYEDYSAKSFERPEWKKMLAEYRKHKSLIDCVLFLKWDRFSRNAGDSYAMLSTLQKLSIEAQAIEQPLDLSIPESKMMLAMYLAMPEVENLRRGLNVLHGMRRARKEGRHMGTAPIGYANKVNENGRKYIAPRQPEADIIRFVFKELANGEKSVQYLWEQAKMLGLNCCKNNFWHLIQNPIYCGKVLVPKYQNEEGYYVEGTHDTLISEELFYTAQDVLHGRKRPKKVKKAVHEEFPLRNFLQCPKCGRQVTASRSKGRAAYYNYYHCTSECGWRHKAEYIHDTFVEELRKFKPHAGMIELYKNVILDVYNSEMTDKQSSKKNTLKEINEQNTRLAKARELLLADAIEASDYKEIKSECERKLNLLEARLSSADPKDEKIDDLLDKALGNLVNIDERYESADVAGKRKIIGSIFVEKLVFEKHMYRTTKVNEAVQLIYSIDKAFRAKEKGQTSGETSLSHEVNLIGFEPLDN